MIKADSKSSDKSGLLAAPASEDGELVRQVAAGEGSGLRRIIDKYQPSIMRTVVSMLGPSADVDDVMQLTFVRFYESIERVRENERIAPYLKRIAVNASLDVLRRRKRGRLRFVSTDDVETTSSAESSLSRIVRSETDELVMEALAALPPKHRAVVTLRFIDGHSTEETAEILGIAYGTVLSRLSRGIDKLRTILERHPAYSEITDTGTEE